MLDKNKGVIEENFSCSCRFLHHNMRISFWYDNKKPYNDLIIEVGATNCDSFFRRLWDALKYVFKREELVYGDVTLMDKEDFLRLKKFIEEVNKKWKD